MEVPVTIHRIPIAAIALVVFALLGGLAVAADGTVYGKGVAGTEVVKISELLDHPDGYVGKTVRVEGLVTEVCPRRGCWINLASDREFETLRFKVEDGVIVFPMDAKGKRAVAEGVFTKIELTKEEALQHAKHMAEERGQPFDAAKAKDLPTVIYQIQGTGAVVR
jgi:hypothetical protein